MIDSIVKVCRGIFRIQGATDNTLIGNVGDRMKVDALVNVVSTNYTQYLLDNNLLFSAEFLVNAASSSVDNPLILFKNPSGSGIRVYFFQLTGNSTISNERTTFRIFQNPTVTTNGTAYTPKPRCIGNGSDPSDCLVYSLPTLSAYTDGMSTVESGENTNSQDIVDVQQMCIMPNNSIVLTGKPKSNNRIQAVTMVWAEVPI